MPSTVHYPARPNRRLRTVTTARMRERHLADLIMRNGLVRTRCGRYIAAGTPLVDGDDKPLCPKCADR